MHFVCTPFSFDFGFWKKKSLVARSSEGGIHAVVPQAACLLALFSPFAILLFFPSAPTFHINNYQVNQSILLFRYSIFGILQCPVSKHVLGVSPSLLVPTV